MINRTLNTARNIAFVMGRGPYWKDLKTRQAKFIEHRLATMDISNVQLALESILTDPNAPKGIDFRDIALAAALRKDIDPSKLLAWTTPKNWEEFWISERFLDEEGNINIGSVQDKIKLSKEKEPLRYSVLRSHFKDPGIKKIIELGSGVSPMLMWWAKEDPSHIAVGLDNSDEAVKTGEEVAGFFSKEIQGSVQFVKGDMTDRNLGEGPLKGAFDACFNFGVLEHFGREKPIEILEQMLRLTRSGGKILVGVPNFDSPSIMFRRWVLHGSKRRHEPESIFNLWWPFGFEQPMKMKELYSLFSKLEKHGLVRDIKKDGVAPFHDFMPAEIWRFKKIYGSKEWASPDEFLLTRLSCMKKALMNMHHIDQSKIAEENNGYLFGNYRWNVPLSAPIYSGLGLMLSLIVLQPAIDALFNNVFSRRFGNQIIISATKV